MHNKTMGSRLGWLRGSKPNKMAYAKLLALSRVVTVPSMRSDSHHVTAGNRFLGQKNAKISTKKTYFTLISKSGDPSIFILSGGVIC